MATIKVRWRVNELVNVMSLFDVQKVYRSTVGPPYNWVEITGPGTRVPLVAGQESYLYDDTTGDISYYYAFSYYNSTTTHESNLSDAIRGGVSGYLTIQDVRDAGFSDTLYSDDQVIDAIQYASSVIEEVTGQWFEAKFRSFRLDVPNTTLEVLLDVPIIALSTASFWDEAIEIDDLWVYNRHLTMGIAEDLRNPKLVFKEDYRTLRQRRLYGGSRRFGSSNQRLALSGYFGYTVLGRTETPAETSDGSQVPVSYGETPPEIKRAALLLVQRYLPTIASGDGDDAVLTARLTGVKTRDQSITLAGPVGTDASYGVTGILEVDRILSAYMGPMRAGVV